MTTTTPKRVQVSWRHSGGKKPENVVSVARPYRWGNRFHVTPERSRAEAVALYETWLMSPENEPLRARAKAELRGKDLACYCPLDGEPCHADVLLRLAND